MGATITSSKIQSISKPQAELSVRDTDRWRCEGGRPAIIGGKTSGGLQDPNRAEQLARPSTGQGEQKATIGTTVAVGGRHAWKNIGSFPKQKTTPHSLSSDIRGATSFIPNRSSFRWSGVFDQSIPTGCDAHNHGSRYRSVRLQLRPSQYQARSPLLRPSQYQARSPLASHVFGSREPTTQTDAPVPSLQQMSVSESAMRRTTAIMLQLHPSRG